MNEQVRFERRSTQRFEFQLPISVRLAGQDGDGCGYTQDLSARGAFFYTDLHLKTDDAIEITLRMPSEITLADAMRVRCRGRVLRCVPPAGGTTAGIAVQLENYEFLPEAETKGFEVFEAAPAAVETHEDKVRIALSSAQPRPALPS